MQGTDVQYAAHVVQWGFSQVECGNFYLKIVFILLIKQDYICVFAKLS